jgi:hypothetical protein
MRAISTYLASVLAAWAAVAACSAALAQEPMFSVIRPSTVLVAQRATADETASPLSMSNHGWSTRAAAPSRSRSTAGRSRPAAISSPAKSPAKSLAAPLQRDLPKLLRDPPKTRRRPLGW